MKLLHLIGPVLLLSLAAAAPQSLAAPKKQKPRPERYVVTMVTADGAERQFLALGYQHQIQSPRDSSSGLPTGKRQHKPFTITKQHDAYTPIFLGALIEGRSFDSLRLTAWRPSPATGQEEQHYSIELENASIAQISRENDPALAGALILEKVEIVYETITFRFPDSGEVITDSWDE